MDELSLLKEKTKTLTITEVRFNHNHGKDGRFTSGGGSKSGGSGGGASGSVADSVKAETDKVKSRLSNNYSPIKKQEIDMAEVKSRGGLTDEEAKASAKVAEKVFSEASAKEPIITDDIVSSVSDVGGQMYGLEFRLKQPTSLAGKIGADAKEDNISFAEAGASIKDSVRYTAVIDEGNFTKGYQDIKSSLESKGYTEVRCKNFYDTYSKGKSDQKAVQCVYEDKSGFKFELQFHTPSSQGAKELNHPLYESQRKATTSDARKKELSAQMREIGTHVPDPKGVMSIKSHG